MGGEGRTSAWGCGTYSRQASPELEAKHHARNEGGGHELDRGSVLDRHDSAAPLTSLWLVDDNTVPNRKPANWIRSCKIGNQIGEREPRSINRGLAMRDLTLYKFVPAWDLPSFSHDCIHLEAYLRLLGLRFTEETYTSAKSSPTGLLPAVEIDGVVAGAGEGDGGDGAASGATVARVIEDLKMSGIDLDGDLSVEDSNDLQAYLSLVETTLVPATLWALWHDDQSYTEWTRAFYSRTFPFPLGYLFPWRHRQEAATKISALKIGSEEEMLKALEKGYNCLTRRLRSRKYFFGRPTSLDALAYAHLLYHKSSPVGKLLFENTLGKFPALRKYVDDVTAAHFGSSAALKDPDFVKGIKMKRKKTSKAKTAEEKVFVYRRNAWLGTTIGITLAYLGTSIIENVKLLSSELVEVE